MSALFVCFIVLYVLILYRSHYPLGTSRQKQGCPCFVSAVFNRPPRSSSIWLDLSVYVYKASAVFWWVIWSRWVTFQVHATVFTTSTSSCCTAHLYLCEYQNKNKLRWRVISLLLQYMYCIRRKVSHLPLFQLLLSHGCFCIAPNRFFFFLLTQVQPSG